MRARVQSASLLGVDACFVEVDVEVSTGTSAYNVVGLPPNAVREGRVRVRAALQYAGFKSSSLITVSLAPGDVCRDGAAFDLPIAVGILAGMEEISQEGLAGYVMLGELSLDGTLRRVPGGLPVALRARAAGARGLILPRECAVEAAAVTEIPIYGAANLSEVVAFLRGKASLPRAERVQRSATPSDLDLSDVRGLETARRALEVAAAGAHNLLLVGPPGSGKSLLARCLPTVMPPLGEQEAIEATAIYSAAGKLDGASLLATRPFRAPHRDVSVAGLIGGGQVPRPGEVSLAHRGVLFLDELPEFRRSTLEALRQPLEDGRVTIVRARAALTYPASFTLVAAMNPCPCGYRGSSVRTCTCSDEQVRRYLGRLSGPLLDRIDVCVEVPHMDYRTLASSPAGESSSAVRERVIQAREVQCARFGRGQTNASVHAREVRRIVLDEAADNFLAGASRRFGYSPRDVDRVLRVARTCADLAGCERVSAKDVAEAVALRLSEVRG